ncbi:hypothetical protein HPB47_016769 [Ixodes persulcatus]|uniref:Uncharacterized protein n=1 Tax=Ixodes persulcatus TaxID=34615 RepID=A0AC60QSL2_IXOPE|nr:hypothetical protein HPB47_016769 [Ixodes persulcatus]
MASEGLPSCQAPTPNEMKQDSTVSWESKTCNIAPQAHPRLTVTIKPKDPASMIATINPMKITEKLEMTAQDGVILARPNRRLNKPLPRELTVGGIYQVPVDITAAELQSAVRATAPVISISRLGKSESVKVVFSTNTLPEYVTVGYTKFKLQPYMEKPQWDGEYVASESGMLLGAGNMHLYGTSLLQSGTAESKVSNGTGSSPTRDIHLDSADVFAGSSLGPVGDGEQKRRYRRLMITAGECLEVVRTETRNVDEALIVSLRTLLRERDEVGDLGRQAVNDGVELDGAT